MNLRNISTLIALVLLTLSTSPSIRAEGTAPDETAWPATMISGTLPVVYINTEDAKPIVDKINPIPAGFWLDPMGHSEIEAVGSAEAPIALTIRGRGNASWKFVKKPYKLKFDKKTSLFGLPKSKHYAILGHITGTGKTWASNVIGFEMARQVGMPWAPHLYPVEFVLNGEYQGVYFIQETIKIDSGRLNIFEQEEGETDPEIIPYGWLLEIDNYTDEYQFGLQENPTQWIAFTRKSPEIVSEAQDQWIRAEMKKINDLIYNSPLDDPRWADYIDVRSAVQYFIVREILMDNDAYNGSYYIYKDKEENAKWHFGPIWDCESYTSYKNAYLCYDNNRPEGFQFTVKWMKRLMDYPIFTETFKEVWAEFYTPEKMEAIEDYLTEYAAPLGEAFEISNRRWYDELMGTSEPYGHDQHVSDMDYHIRMLRNATAWMNEHQDIAEYVKEASGVEEVIAASDFISVKGNLVTFNTDALQPGSAIVTDAAGRVMFSPTDGCCDLSDLQPGLYIISARTLKGETVSRKLVK